ncbi:hypothetical protein [Leifsonia aquatica]|uniref:hypothetical protein n=1 Tax=Leifsonia aquatica TaxID=144185 RepID=UPI0037FCF2F6
MPQISKGDRKFLGTRVPEDLEKAAERRRKELGLSMTDYLLTLLAADTQMSAYAKTNERLELPITA